MARALALSSQDYLKNIYALAETGGFVHTSGLAIRLGVLPASVTRMVQKLAALRPALVLYKRHPGARLTQAGKRAALEVIRHHRLLEAWLAQALGYSWDEVHGEAENLEHAISEKFEERVSASLGDPARDPHGDPIPSADLVMPEDGSVVLSQLAPRQEGIVRRIRADDAGLLKHLQRQGFAIGVRVTTLATGRYDNVMKLQLRNTGRRVTLGPASTERIHVEIMSKSMVRKTWKPGMNHTGRISSRFG